ncbi:hypothetical protein BLOT_013754 [Blomia tropicalis]|nr:hypothetical protein BLOT_013754 [Blomia tropicalis]
MNLRTGKPISNGNENAEKDFNTKTNHPSRCKTGDRKKNFSKRQQDFVWKLENPIEKGNS